MTVNVLKKHYPDFILQGVALSMHQVLFTWHIGNPHLLQVKPTENTTRPHAGTTPSHDHVTHIANRKH